MINDILKLLKWKHLCQSVIMLTLLNGVDIGAAGADNNELSFIFSIWVAICRIFGWLTNQLQICNWLVIDLNWGGTSSLEGSWHYIFILLNKNESLFIVQ